MRRFSIVLLFIVVFLPLFTSCAGDGLDPRVDLSWVHELGYRPEEVHHLSFTWSGERSCPEIPVEIGGITLDLGIDTGCGAGVAFTDQIEDRIDYSLLERVEAFNRDGSHRGWSKRISIGEMAVFGESYKNVSSTISDWKMYSSRKFNGIIGLAYFRSRTVTLDYVGRRIAVGKRAIDYAELDEDKFTVLPLLRSTSRGQRDLPFFAAELRGDPITVYLDTGKNYSFIYDPESSQTIGSKPSEFIDIPLTIGERELFLEDIVPVGSLAQAEGLPYPTMIEMNSDQIWKQRLVVTLDLIDQKIIFRIP